MSPENTFHAIVERVGNEWYRAASIGPCTATAKDGVPEHIFSPGHYWSLLGRVWGQLTPQQCPIRLPDFPSPHSPFCPVKMARGKAAASSSSDAANAAPNTSAKGTISALKSRTSPAVQSNPNRQAAAYKAKARASERIREVKEKASAPPEDPNVNAAGPILRSAWPGYALVPVLENEQDAEAAPPQAAKPKRTKRSDEPSATSATEGKSTEHGGIVETPAKRVPLFLPDDDTPSPSAPETSLSRAASPLVGPPPHPGEKFAQQPPPPSQQQQQQHPPLEAKKPAPPPQFAPPPPQQQHQQQPTHLPQDFVPPPEDFAPPPLPQPTQQQQQHSPHEAKNPAPPSPPKQQQQQLLEAKKQQRTHRLQESAPPFEASTPPPPPQQAKNPAPPASDDAPNPLADAPQSPTEGGGPSAPARPAAPPKGKASKVLHISKEPVDTDLAASLELLTQQFLAESEREQKEEEDEQEDDDGDEGEGVQLTDDENMEDMAGPTEEGDEGRLAVPRASGKSIKVKPGRVSKANRELVVAAGQEIYDRVEDIARQIGKPVPVVLRMMNLSHSETRRPNLYNMPHENELFSAYVRRFVAAYHAEVGPLNTAQRAAYYEKLSEWCAVYDRELTKEVISRGEVYQVMLKMKVQYLEIAERNRRLYGVISFGGIACSVPGDLNGQAANCFWTSGVDLERIVTRNEVTLREVLGYVAAWSIVTSSATKSLAPDVPTDQSVQDINQQKIRKLMTPLLAAWEKAELQTTGTGVAWIAAPDQCLTLEVCVEQWPAELDIIDSYKNIVWVTEQARHAYKIFDAIQRGDPSVPRPHAVPIDTLSLSYQYSQFPDDYKQWLKTALWVNTKNEVLLVVAEVLEEREKKNPKLNDEKLALVRDIAQAAREERVSICAKWKGGAGKKAKATYAQGAPSAADENKQQKKDAATKGATAKDAGGSNATKRGTSRKASQPRKRKNASTEAASQSKSSKRRADPDDANDADESLPAAKRRKGAVRRGEDVESDHERAPAKSRRGQSKPRRVQQESEHEQHESGDEDEDEPPPAKRKSTRTRRPRNDQVDGELVSDALDNDRDRKRAQGSRAKQDESRRGGPGEMELAHANEDQHAPIRFPLCMYDRFWERWLGAGTY
ncbi:hypothetical protein AURDEDRAFT_128066 [Auricularia subglabra TFB-10046 SS5]|uniref:Uncharacterized protein n=1 Tax=Auricularia subglabra (strain TFB-10046 / SS5) TaxID=717982 RepID=J0LJ02_AURST|nr:hypothetical protein AURDEDRAFT_128066 [Auricularia subglabra TFB-10046 SS5]